MAGLRSQPAWWAAARQQGLVHSDAPVADNHEPGPLLIGLAMLGALACLLPLGVFFALALDERFLVGPGGFVTGVLALVAGGWLLRGYTQAFVNCVALVLWALGGGLLVFNLGDLAFNSRPGALMLCTLAAVLAAGGAWLAQARWIQAVMGVCWAVATYAFLGVAESFGPLLLLLQLHVGSLLLVALWWLWLRAEPARLAQPQQWWAQPRWAAFADAAVIGVLGASLGGFGWWWLTSWAGVADAPDWGEVEAGGRILVRGIAAAVTLLATVLLVRTWKARGTALVEDRSESREASGTRLQAMLYLAGVLLAVAAWFSTGLAIVALVAAGALAGARWRIAVLCAAIALFLLGRFYYFLGWPLAVKGLGLAVLGAALLLGLWLLRRATATVPAGQGQGVPSGALSKKGQLAWLLAGAVLVFGLVNWDVRSKEQVIAYGQRILVPLVPVDPRSLMQGDYMALNFSLPQKVTEGLENVLAPVKRVRASVDAQGVATVLSLVEGNAQPGPGEVILPLKQLKGRWVLVTDAYFFPEGQGAHFAPAKFGDFRVLPDGRALLVGLADSEGRVMKPLPVRSIWEIAPVSSSTEATEATEVELMEAPATMDAEPTSAEVK